MSVAADFVLRDRLY